MAEGEWEFIGAEISRFWRKALKRDMDLVRKLLIHIEDNCTSEGIDSPDIMIEGFSEDDIGYNLQLMYNGELLDAIESTAFGDEWACYLINGLTWQGHDFLDNIRNDNVWQGVKKALIPVGSASFQIMTQLAVSVMKQQLGLP